MPSIIVTNRRTGSLDDWRVFSRTSATQPATRCCAKAGDLLAAAHARAKERARLLNEQRIAEAAKRRAEDEASRTRYLDQLGRRQPEIWKQVAAHIQTRQPKDYGKAVSLLTELRDLAVRRGQLAKCANPITFATEEFTPGWCAISVPYASIP